VKKFSALFAHLKVLCKCHLAFIYLPQKIPLRISKPRAEYKYFLE